MTILFIVVVALLLDHCFGEPKRFHPLVGFGWVADRIESSLNQGSEQKWQGLFAWALAVVPITLLVMLVDQSLQQNEWLGAGWSALVLYLAIGWRSLIDHAQAVIEPLRAGDLAAARVAVARIVSRDTAEIDETGVARAATESVLENGADAIFAALFWFFLLGVPGVVLYRLSNTLDAMWGYKNPRYLEFGWAAARIDDLLNYIPAQLTALSYALLGNRKQAFECWKTQGLKWKSPSAGPVMASGAGALNISLGGSEIYQGVEQYRSRLGPQLSDQTRATAQGLARACQLINKTILLWLGVILLLETLFNA